MCVKDMFFLEDPAAHVAVVITGVTEITATVRGWFLSMGVTNGVIYLSGQKEESWLISLRFAFRMAAMSSIFWLAIFKQLGYEGSTIQHNIAVPSPRSSHRKHLVFLRIVIGIPQSLSQNFRSNFECRYVVLCLRLYCVVNISFSFLI